MRNDKRAVSGADIDKYGFASALLEQNVCRVAWIFCTAGVFQFVRGVLAVTLELSTDSRTTNEACCILHAYSNLEF